VNVGLWLPTFAHPLVDGPDPSVAANAARAERLGFDSLWALDHLLPTARVHSSSWYDPLVSLAHAAAVTETIELGTASLVAGFRHPIALAKQLASLAALAGPRVTLGASSGWFDREYELFGYAMRERGARTDECLRALRLLLDEPVATFEGRYWRFRDVTLAPRPAWRLPILVGGGSRLPEAGADVDVPVLAERVLARILAHDGWLAPCAGDEELTLRDLATVRAAAGRPLRCAHVQWLHAVETDDRELALREQLPALRRIMGAGRSDGHLAACYLTGSVADVRARVARLREAGFDDVVVGPVDPGAEQLELLAGILFPAARAPGAKAGA
jgi:alkanesulfonate monooxygenase SsuD/methylene tetrahydromethanopterin reductase-like flavin-dependent oxidoreductase (luciferase family)